MTLFRDKYENLINSLFIKIVYFDYNHPFHILTIPSVIFTGPKSISPFRCTVPVSPVLYRRLTSSPFPPFLFFCLNYPIRGTVKSLYYTVTVLSPLLLRTNLVNCQRTFPVFPRVLPSWRTFGRERRGVRQVNISKYKGRLYLYNTRK